MPASKKYRDQLERLGQLEAEQAQRDREREAAAATAPRRSSGSGGHPRPSSSSPPPQVLRQQQQPQQQRQPVGLLGSLVLGIRRHPLTPAMLLASSFAYFNIRRAAKKTGCIVSKSPHLTIWEPPISYLSKLLNDELPFLSPSSSLPSSSLNCSPASFERLHRYRSKKVTGREGEKEGEGDLEEGLLVRESLAVGKGEVVYRKAVGLVRTLRLLDAASSSSSSSLGSFYSSETGEEGVFVTKRSMVPGDGRRGGGGALGQWMLMPVRIARREGRAVVGKEKKSKKKKTTKKRKMAEEGGSSGSSSSSSNNNNNNNKKKNVEAVYEEVFLRSLPGCPWRGELRLSASWQQAGGKGGKREGEVIVEVAWFTPCSSSPSLPPSFQQQVAARLLQEAQALMEREMAMHKVRERQQEQFASDAKAAALERRKKERQLLLHPPPDKKKWAKLQRHSGGGGGGGEKAGRWQPSADLAARRNPRKGG
ncbi:Hypothetical protein NocV09_01500990 [Nannochloropsis oceanica]